MLPGLGALGAVWAARGRAFVSGCGVLGFAGWLWRVGRCLTAAPLAGAAQVLAAAQSWMRTRGLEGRRVPLLPPPPPLPPRVPRPGKGRCDSWPGMPPCRLRQARAAR